MKFAFVSLLIALFMLSCSSRSAEVELTDSITPVSDTMSLLTIVPPCTDSILVENPPELAPYLIPFERDSIRANLQRKIDNNETLVVHCLVPLCDNENQGIVPTTKSLGDGFSTRTNLYWATSHGQKKYFQRHAKWSEVVVEHTATDTILERVAFERKFDNGAKVLMICDAYRGDQMEACLKDYFAFLAGEKYDSLVSGSSVHPIGEAADMIAFNGHNGLMDVYVAPERATRFRQKDAVSISCSSEYDFCPYYEKANCYPLVNTTNLLYPGAFIMDGIIEKWAMMETEENIRLAAGDAYNDVKKCGQKGARNLFSTGWVGN